MLILITLLLLLPTQVHSEAFSSTANLIQLVKTEREIITNLEAYIKDEQNRLEEIKRYIDEIKSKNQSNDDLFYAGHPVNAYNLIKRWYKLSTMTPNTPNYNAISNKLQTLKLPSHDDYIGASAALIRLQRTFSLEVDDVANGIIKDDGGAKELAADDFAQIGKIALINNDYGLAGQWLEKAVANPRGGIPNIETYSDLVEVYKGLGDLEKAAYYAKKALDLEPFNEELDNRYNALNMQIKNTPKSEVTEKHNVTSWKRFLPSWKENYEKLCRGELDKISDPRYTKDLKCRYKPGLIPYVVYKEEILSWDPRIGMFHDVISDAEAEMIKNKAYPNLERARVGDPGESSVIEERISKVAWLWDEDKDIHKLSIRVKDITRLETQYRNPLSSAEPFQVVNYGIGGQYEPHVDFYENRDQLQSVPDYILNTGDRIATFLFYDTSQLQNLPDFIQNTGDRISTFLFYLTDVKHGGSTVFPRVNIRVPVTKNGAAFWYNAKLSGEFDKRTEHAGCPVLLGQKWVSNKWIREYGQEFNRPCGLSPESVDLS